ncbi:efflux transporter outer membrane subunit [Methylomonas fluvii]|uniref:Efflux transporter outer membrane subunit n=1 Tax=Methylomonas fluvii TaxID=1854564 RepID=A0ABR9D953_9GAMM|nr:efflux transporter outer membrane subunit [Methylomonas fluvii]MBD9359643.1 efflux transporter outer membrane subunit [Methylomonas fluvii]
MPAKPCRPMLWILSALSALWAVGCESPAPRDPHALAFQTPPRWSSNGHFAEAAATGWLAAFNDEHLTGLVSSGLADNFDLKSAAARVDAAREQAVIAGSGRWPQLSLTPVYQRAKSNVGGESSESGAFTALFNLSWELDVWGRIKAGQQAAETEAEATGDDYRAAQLSLAARIAQAYFEFTEAQLQATVAAQSVKDRGTIVDLVRGRFNRGLTRGLDLRLVLTDLANAQAQLAQARNDAQLIGKRLQTLLGRYPGNGQEGATEFDATFHLPQPPETLSAGLPAELLERRPDVIAAFKRLRAADSRLESAEKALLPRVTLTGAGGSSSAALTEIIDPRAAAWNLAAGLAQPLFTGDRLQGEIRFNQAKVQEAFNQYQSVALNAFREVEQALAAEAWLRTQEQALREAVEQTEASRKLAVYSYRQGLIEILTLLDSYRSTLNAQSAHLAVQRQLLNNRINLYLALGGGV